MAATWKRLDTLLEKLTPVLRRALKPPTKKRPINELEKSLCRSLPIDVKESLLCHDGQADKAGGCVFGNRLLPVKDIIAFWQMSRGHDLDAVPENRIRSFPKRAVQLCETHPGWIPLAADWTGNYIGVDLAPDLEGDRGQVIVFGRDECHHYVLAPTWGEFLANYADDLRDGHFEIIFEDHSDIPEFRFHQAGGDTIQAIGNYLVGKEEI